MQRRPIDEPLGLGIRALDGLLTAGRGQRLGIFAGTGVGKSVLMGMICRHTQADVNVVALVGERGREVRDFIEGQLGPEGLAHSVVVVCTSDEAPALRVRAGLHATAIAEYFRDQGRDVLLLMDSLTRVAMAQRQIGLAAGEPPTAKGYPPSVYSLLPRLLERAGRTQTGSITGVYTVLVEGDDLDEPLADAVRGILDGHVWLARTLANRGHYPAIDVLNSISRVAPDVTDPRQQADLLSAQQQGLLDPLVLQRGHAWIAYLRRTIATRQVHRAEQLEQLKQLQAVWREARTQMRIIEKLRERRWQEYAHDRQRREQAAADELAQQLQGYAAS